MADFQTVMVQAARMCKSHEICGSCPVGRTRTVNCRKFIFDHPDEFEEIVMKWAAEHPLVTNGDKFEEIFGVPFWAISCGVTPAISKWLRSEYKEAKK
jgi:hypothetical protein